MGKRSTSLNTVRLTVVLICSALLLIGCGDSGTSPDTSAVRQPEGDVNSFWDQYDWADLTADEQALWETLGWDEASWQGETEAPDSENNAWSDLTDAQRAALEQLGYDEQYWDS